MIGHDGRIVSGGPLVEGFEQRLDFAKPRVDLVRQFVGAGVGLLQSVELGAQRVVNGLLVLRERRRVAGDTTQAGGVAEREVGRGLDYNDAPAVRKILRDAAPDGDRLPALIVGIVKSAPFQMRRIDS